MHYIFVINGRADYAFIEEDIKRQLEGMDIQYSLYLTSGTGDGTRYTRIYCDLHRTEEACFVACGGSGITNEVASGIVGEKNKSMAILAYGYTNDFLKMFPDRDFHSVQKILNGEVTNVDILKINDNYALNTINFGFDSIVAREVYYLTEVGKRYPYERGIIRAFFGGRFNRIKVIADGKPLNKWMILNCAIGNGRYVAGKYMCTPLADPCDGLMDVCILKIMSLLRFALLLPHYQKGEQIGIKYNSKVIYTKAKHLDIISKNLITMVLDGELLPGTKFSVDVLPQAVKIVLPNS